MKKFFLFVIVLAIIGFIMMATCPNEKDHEEAICLAIDQAIDEKLGDCSFSLMGAVKFGSKFALKKGAELFIDLNVAVENYGVVSIGRYTFNGRNKVISVGLFNHVFTMSKNDILEEIEKRGF